MKILRPAGAVTYQCAEAKSGEPWALRTQAHKEGTQRAPWEKDNERARSWVGRRTCVVMAAAKGTAGVGIKLLMRKDTKAFQVSR
jgi:hypothetical protein